jgi:hypothetical protein
MNSFQADRSLFTECTKTCLHEFAKAQADFKIALGIKTKLSS